MCEHFTLVGCYQATSHLGTHLPRTSASIRLSLIPADERLPREQSQKSDDARSGYPMTSVRNFVVIETAFIAVQFLLVGPALALSSRFGTLPRP